MNQNRNNIGILLIYSLVVFFIGNQLLPITDPVESNYVETAKEMILTGNYFSPVIYGNYWYDKPILFYLELIAAFQWFGFTDFAARFFPAVFSTIGLFLTYGFGACLAGRRQGLAAALILGTSLEYWYIGHAVITDMTLFVTVSGTLIAFYLGWSRNRPVYYYLAFAAAALAVLTKGPIGLCLPGLIILLFLLVQRSLRSLLSWHILLGFLLFAALCAVWYYPMYRMHGMDFVDTFWVFIMLCGPLYLSIRGMMSGIFICLCFWPVFFRGRCWDCRRQSGVSFIGGYRSHHRRPTGFWRSGR